MSATVIPFPSSRTITSEELDACVAMLQQSSLVLDEIEAERSPDADPQLADELLDHADHLIDLSEDETANDAELDAAIDEFDRLASAASLVVTRASVRRTAGDATLAQVERAVTFASAMAVSSHMASVAFEHEGELMIPRPLDRGVLRRYLRAVGEGFAWSDANVPDAGAFRRELLDVLHLALLDGPPSMTTMRDAMHRLFLVWSDRELVAKGACRIARDRLVGGRGSDLEDRREAFEVGVAAAIATRILGKHVPDVAAFGSGDPDAWLDVLQPAGA